ncbi:ribulose-phosphate 3-epimerase [Pavlovales sp. CCMP2436]|nr:ribulose-phosphate 3-epimerase [Pavlovales sp. CCMP2436]
MLAAVLAIAALVPPRNLVVHAVRALRAPDKVVIAPSVAKANFLELGRECTNVVDAGSEWLHFAVQDGRMVPKISFGTPVVSALRPLLPNTVFDVKLGCMDPERRIQEFAKAGADILSVHPEACVELAGVLSEIRQAGCASGVVLNPATPVESIQHVLELVDLVVIMLVSPGYGGPTHVAEACRKIEKLKKLCEMRGVNPWISVDGGVTPSSAGVLHYAGANVFVAGSSVFHSDDKKRAIEELLTAAKSHHWQVSTH